jgi:GNAT superfamily N-acetyltransferase
VKILSFKSSFASGLADCYNRIISTLPHCRPATPETFASLEGLKSPNCQEEMILAAINHEGDVTGFVHVGIALPPTEAWHPQGEPAVIRFLAYQSGQRPVGEALLKAAEAWARERNRTAMAAYHSLYMYPFYYLPHSLLSSRLAHISALFGQAGYQVMDWSEIFYDWQDFLVPQVRKPELDFVIDVQEQEILHHDLPGVEVTAPQEDGNWAGRCIMLRVDEDWCICDRLDVIEPLQGRGIGKYLLARGMEEMRKQGCRHSLISTGSSNYRAQLFYSNFGFAFCDWTTSSWKELSAG